MSFTRFRDTDPHGVRKTGSSSRWTSLDVSTGFYDCLVALVVNEPVAVALHGDHVGVYSIRIYRSMDAAVVIVAGVPGRAGGLRQQALGVAAAWGITITE